MKNKEIKKRQLMGWSYKTFKQMRKKLREIDRKDFNIPKNIKFK